MADNFGSLRPFPQDSASPSEPFADKTITVLRSLNVQVDGGALGVQKLNSADALIQRHHRGSPMQPMYYIGLDVHKKKISYCVKDGGGKVHAEGWIPATRCDLDLWMKTLPQPWII